GHQHDELLAAVAADDVRRARGGADDARELAQDDVARLVAEPVVDALEMVDVDHDHADRAPVPAGAEDLEPEPFLHLAPVVQAGEGIVHRLLEQLVAQPRDRTERAATRTVDPTSPR